MNMPLSVETLENADSAKHTEPEAGVMILPTPAQLRQQLPLPAALQLQIQQQRRAVCDVLNGTDPRTLIVIGPCSVHDEVAALEYGKKLAALADDVCDRFLVVMRAYLEKPRTTVGWKGLLYDPERTGDGDLDQGLVRSRRLLLNLAGLGLPLATEALSPMAMDYLEDLVSWTAVGARTTESQIHREMASGLAMPVGFKNGTDGGIDVAINAMKSAAHSHHRLGYSADGHPAMITTSGNANTHMVLRGGRGITNYDVASIEQTATALAAGGVSAAIMVDCSHDNACKQADRQITIAHEVMAQKYAGNSSVRGLMLESFIEPGRQDDSEELLYGCSITDPCIGWKQTEALLRSL